MEIGERIKKRREDLGMSQNELAKRVGYTSRSSVAKVETNANGITQSKIIKFAKALETTPSYLMGWDDEKPAQPEQAPTDKNIIKLAGRDGTYIERELTDEQIELMKSMVKQLPDADDL